MEQQIFTILQNQALTGDVYELILSGDTSGITVPGQFVNVKLDGFFLRRPLSVCDWGEDRLTLLYKVVGQGTTALCAMEPGQKLDLLCGLGNGYDVKDSSANPLLIGGGVGTPPLYGLARRLIEQGKQVTVILGFNTRSEIFYEEQFSSLGARVLLTTADGSAGIQGFVTAAIPQAGNYSYVYTCGPEPMLKAVYTAIQTGGQFSFEERMGCGFGACMGCSCKTKYGYKRICKEGPVLRKEEIIW